MLLLSILAYIGFSEQLLNSHLTFYEKFDKLLALKIKKVH